jgi:hypothetical protein
MKYDLTVHDVPLLGIWKNIRLMCIVYYGLSLIAYRESMSSYELCRKLGRCRSSIERHWVPKSLFAHISSLNFNKWIDEAFMQTASGTSFLCAFRKGKGIGG